MPSCGSIRREGSSKIELRRQVRFTVRKSFAKDFLHFAPSRCRARKTYLSVYTEMLENEGDYFVKGGVLLYSRDGQK